MALTKAAQSLRIRQDRWRFDIEERLVPFAFERRHRVLQQQLFLVDPLDHGVIRNVPVADHLHRGMRSRISSRRSMMNSLCLALNSSPRLCTLLA